jgi:flagellar M-ring protein FliF
MAKIEIKEQVKTFYNKLTTLQKVIIASSVGLALALSIFLIASTGTPEEKAVLYKSLEQEDAAKIVENLKEKNIPYEITNNGTTILVDKDKVYDTRLTLAAEGLPESGTVGYEIFDKTNLGMSEFVQKLNYRRALEGELARTISSLDEVKKARVHLVIPEKQLFEKDKKDPTASVSLWLNSGRSISKVSIEGIQNLVASSVEGMLTDHVTVVDQRGKIISPPPLDESSIAGLTNMQHQQQIEAESHLSGKVQSLLDGVLGPNNSEVRVNVELDFTKIEKTITDFDPERQVTRSEQTITEISESTDSLSYPAVSMARDKQNVISNYEISKTESRIVEEVGNVRRLSVAAMVNDVVKVVTNENGEKTIEYVPRTEEEMKKLEETIKNAVGYDPGRNDQITVLNVPFDMTHLEEELRYDIRPIWWQDPENIKLFFLILAMLITIFILYRVLQSKQIRERFRIALGLPAHIEIDEDELDEEEEEELEELEFDEDDLMLLPAELPDQLLLEGERMDREDGMPIEGEDEGLDQDALARRAKAGLEDDGGDMTEDQLMSLEIKNKVQDFIEDQPQEAARLVRVLIQQDYQDMGMF